MHVRKRTWLPLADLIPLPNEGTGGSDGGNSSSGTGGADGNVGDGNSTGKTADGKGGDSKGEGKTFTQAEVDELIVRRIARATRGLDEIKAKAAEWDKHQAASASDEDRRAAEVRAAAEQAAAEATAKANARVVSAEVKAAAVAAGFHDPGDALARLRDQLGDVDVDDDGQVDGKAVEKLVTDLAVAAPHLVKGQQGPPRPGQGGVGTGSGGSGRTAATSLEAAINQHYQA